MTTETKPSVITAAEFVADGYAAKIAAGECVVYDHDKDYVVGGKQMETLVWIEYCDNGNFHSYDPNSKFTVRWLPATPASDELASLRAANARYRTAMIAAADDLDNAYGENTMVAARILRAALANVSI